MPKRDVVDVDCCTPAGGTALDRGTAERLADLLKAVADPARLQILSVLRQSRDQAACVCDLTSALDLRQSTVSHHLRVLTEAGLLTSTKRGYWTWYSLVPQRLAEVAAILR